MDKKVPMAASSSSVKTMGWPAAAAALTVIFLLIKPLKAGIPAMEKAAEKKQTATSGSFFAIPPTLLMCLMPVA